MFVKTITKLECSNSEKDTIMKFCKILDCLTDYEAEAIRLELNKCDDFFEMVNTFLNMIERE